jgi:hypothetical protein
MIPESGPAIGGNVIELSLYGCYLDCAASLAPRTRVLVKIHSPNAEYFEAAATVIYANPNTGIGLVFREVKAHFLTVLRKWLLDAMRQTEGSKQKRDDDQDAGK